jgi:hypothetical protein
MEGPGPGCRRRPARRCGCGTCNVALFMDGPEREIRYLRRCHCIFGISSRVGPPTSRLASMDLRDGPRFCNSCSGGGQTGLISPALHESARRG